MCECEMDVYNRSLEQLCGDGVVQFSTTTGMGIFLICPRRHMHTRLWKRVTRECTASWTVKPVAGWTNHLSEATLELCRVVQVKGKQQ